VPLIHRTHCSVNIGAPVNGCLDRACGLDALAVTNGGHDAVMDQHPTLISVNARIGSSELGIEVDIRLRDLDGRWLAVAEFGGEPEVGIGASPRAALAASLATLGQRTAAALMADPQLFGVSTEIRRAG
jgi:hypothetical protein